MMLRRFWTCLSVALCALLAWFLGFWIESCFDDLALQLQIVLPMLVIGLAILWTLLRCLDASKSDPRPADDEMAGYRFRIK